VSVSRLRQLDISAAALLEYGTEGCDCCGCGGEGLRGVKSDGAEVVAQPSRLATSTSSISSNASRAGGGKLLSFISTTLALLLKRSSLDVRRSRSGLPLKSYMGSPGSVSGEVGKG
jgi:hypothetical protein